MAGLQDVWGLGGYLQRRGQIQGEESQNLQQASGLMGILAQQQQMQQRQQAASEDFGDTGGDDFGFDDA